MWLAPEDGIGVSGDKTTCFSGLLELNGWNDVETFVALLFGMLLLAATSVVVVVVELWLELGCQASLPFSIAVAATAANTCCVVTSSVP